MERNNVSLDEKPADGFLPHTSHWGVFSARMRGGELEVKPHRGDPDPNEILQNFPAALRHRARIAQPMIRRGWLENGPGPDARRGRDDYVAMSWTQALDLLGKELTRVRDDFGPGRDLRRVLWLGQRRPLPPRPEPDPPLPERRLRRLRPLGHQLLLRRLTGAGAAHHLRIRGADERNVTWEQVAAHSEIVVAFGGMALKNSMVAGGSVSKHVERRAHAAGRPSAAANSCW
jgi:biotin/methionine sulfoxide reductase